MTHAETMLQAIEAVLEGRITADIEQYSIAGRQITKIPVEELIKLRQYYRLEVIKEHQAEQLTSGELPNKNIRVRFV